MKYPSLSHLSSFALKSIFSGIRGVTLDSFFSSIYLGCPFPSFYPKIVYVFNDEVCFLEVEKRWIVFSIPIC